MTRLLFENAAPAAPASPNRMDVACFVGFVRPRPPKGRTPWWRRTPSADLSTGGQLAAWLEERGWLAGPYRRKGARQLLDVPVPIESWEQFTELFEWRRPTATPGVTATTYLGAAVRSFFAQGGRRCYVVRVGRPWRVGISRETRRKKLMKLLPGFPSRVLSSNPMDQNSWRGIGHVFGLADVALLCVPDLPEIFGVDAPRPAPAVRVTLPKEQFVECSPGADDDDGAPIAMDSIVARSRAPRADAYAYHEWAQAINRIVDVLRTRAREVQLIAAVPIPTDGSPADVRLLENGLARFLDDDGSDVDTGIASSFVQLAFPWVRTPGSADLPERLEPPDGVLAGVLARNALLRGAYRSAAGLHLADVYDVFPPLSRRDVDLTLTTHNDTKPRGTLVERVSLLGRVPRGLTVLSDVTASNHETYRPGSVHRLISVIARAARHLGEAVTFEVSNEQLWVRVKSEMERLLIGLHADGALRGATTDEAFEVRCDYTTMTQQDIDSGRVIASVQIAAAAPIEIIRIMLAMEGGGVVSLAPALSREVAA